MYNATQQFLLLEDDQPNGFLDEILLRGSQLVCDIGRPVLLNYGVLFFIAVVMIFFWHLQALCPGCFHKRPWLTSLVAERSNRSMWEALVVLNVYFSPYRPSWTYKYPFAISATFIIAETLLLFVIRAFRDGPTDTKKKTDYIAQNDKLIHNKYMDISYKLRRVFLYFWVQTALICYFVYWLNSDKETKQLDNVSILKWVVAVNLSMTAGEQDDVGVTFHISHWKMLLRRNNDNIKVDGIDFVFGCRCLPARWHLWIRCFMDCLVNGFGRSMLMALAPIALSVEKETIDFIKDALALFFVTKLDDLKTHMTLEDCIEALEAEQKRLVDEGYSEDLVKEYSRYAPWMQQWREGLDKKKEERRRQARGTAIRGGRAAPPDGQGDEENETTALTSRSEDPPLDSIR